MSGWLVVAALALCTEPRETPYRLVTHAEGRTLAWLIDGTMREVPAETLVQPRLKFELNARPSLSEAGPIVSPDRTKHAYVVSDPFMAARNAAIVITAADGSNPRLVRSGARWDVSPVWSDDSRSLDFLGAQAGRNDHRPHRYDVQTEQVEPLVDVVCGDTGLARGIDGALLFGVRIPAPAGGGLPSGALLRWKGDAVETVVSTGLIVRIAADPALKTLAVLTTDDVRWLALSDGRTLGVWSPTAAVGTGAECHASKIVWRPDGAAAAVEVVIRGESGPDPRAYFVLEPPTEGQTLRAVRLPIPSFVQLRGWIRLEPDSANAPAAQ
jgi:hypothetical protein